MHCSWMWIFCFCLIHATYFVRNGKYRYVARVMYDGTNFRGFQVQAPKFRTVQGELNKQLSKRFDSIVKSSAASRTDVGVHARGQAIHFDLQPGCLDCTQFTEFEFKFNLMLPKDIKIYNVSLTPLGTPEQVIENDIFHVTKSSIGKHYRYRFCTNTFVDPLYRHLYAHVYQPLNLIVFQRCLQYFQGTHDFVAFTNSISGTTRDWVEYQQVTNQTFNTTRTIHQILLVEEEQTGYFHIDFYIESALHKMIRNIVGSSLAVATGNMPEEYLQRLLLLVGESNYTRKDNDAKPAPPEGLTLERVYYDHY
jgi:tRNA pseudouridine38-40 synthase